MKLFLHFLKSNILYNKLELAISFGIATFICVSTLFYGLFEKELLLSIAFYGFLYAYMSNKRKTSLKYLISLPASKSELVVAKAAADGIYFVPVAMVIALCNKLFKAGLDGLPLAVLLFMVCMALGIVLLENEVEEPRMENGKGSFLNRLIYVRKFLDMMIVLGLGALFMSVIYSLEISMGIKQYLMIMIMSFVVIFKYKKCLKLMLDESLSYFVFKRDLVKTGLKLGVPVAVMVLVGFTMPGSGAPYGEKGIFAHIKSGNVEKTRSYISKIGPDKAMKEKGERGFTPLKAAVLSGNLGMLRLLSGTEERKRPSKQNKKELYDIMSLALESKKTDVFEFGINNLGFDVNHAADKSLKTQLHLASEKCDPAYVEYFIKEGAKVNMPDSKGNTPLHSSVASGCVGATVLLLQAGADPTLKNKEGKSPLEELKKIPSLEYYAKKFVKKDKRPSRGLASDPTLSP